MRNLKVYLKYRDQDPAFDVIKEKNRLGVPSVVIDDQIFIVDNEDKTIERIYEQYMVE